ncbi:RNA polymerase sigma factor [candidate division KSB1 bacterium]
MQYNTQTSDVELMKAVQSGNVDQLNFLYLRHEKRLFNFFLRLTKDTETSKELVQEVFIRILKYYDTFDGRSRFTTWMFRIAYNCFYDRKTKQNSRNEEEIDLDDLYTPAVQLDRLIRDEQRQLLSEVLLRINERDRAILTMHTYLDMKYREIAEIFHCTESTIKTRAFRALKRLRKIYKISLKKEWS